MNNQICPWRSDSESLIFDNNSIIFEPIQIVKSSSAHKAESKPKRPFSSETFKRNKTQKKLIRPISCQVNFKSIRKNHEQKQQSVKIHFVTQIESPIRKSLAAKIPINEINFQATPGKRLKRNVSAVYSGYSNFSKQKVKKAESPTSILSKNIMVLSRGKQKDSDEIYLNKRLATVLKLTKYAITPEVKEQMNKKKIVIKENNEKQKQIKIQAFKRTGFVYYNQSFLENFSPKF